MWEARKELLLNWYSGFQKRIAIPLSKVFSLGWVFNLAGFIYNIFRNLVNMITTLLEGDGGFLWVLLLLTLLITLITSGGIS